MKDLFIFQAFFRASSFDSEILKISISKAFSKIVLVTCFVVLKGPSPFY